MHSDLAYMGLVELGKKIARKKISPVEVTRMMLERIEQLDSKLKCYATVMATQALKDAKRCENEIMKGQARGPLHGVPVAVKDLCDTKGTVTAAGIPMFRKRVPKRDGCGEPARGGRRVARQAADDRRCVSLAPSGGRSTRQSMGPQSLERRVVERIGRGPGRGFGLRFTR